MEAQRVTQMMSAVCFTSCHDDYVRPFFGWAKSMVMYIAKAAWLLRSFNILVCKFMKPAAMRLIESNYISERRLTLITSRTQ